MAEVQPIGSGEAVARRTAALDASRELILIVDATPAALGGPQVEFANAACLRETGYAVRDVVGQPLGSFAAPADHREPEADAAAPRAVAMLMRRKDGSAFLYEGAATALTDAGGDPAGCVFVGRNVEERNVLRDRFASIVSALEHADDNVFVIDQHFSDERYTVTFANESVVERTGYTREEFERDSSRILNGPLTDQAVRSAALAQLRAGRTARIELLLYRKDGSTYWSELSARPIADEFGRYTRFVMIERDVTERRRRREELDVLWTAFAHAHDSIIVYERPAPNQRIRIVYVNEATITQSGFSREELLTGSTGTGPLTDRAEVERLRVAMLRGEPMRTRLALYRKDGSMYWGEIDGRPVRDAAGNVTHWISIERDITDAVERERTLSVLLDASRALFGTLEGAALDAAFLDALGSALDAAVGFTHGAPDPLVAAALASPDAVAVDAGRLAVVVRTPGRDPRAVIVTTGRELGTHDRAVPALLAQTYAAAARNAALFEEVHQQRAAVLALSKLKGDLISMLAHDLNNPLTSIRGFAEFLAEEQLDEAERGIATTSIIRATERLVELGRETLALARLEDNALVPTRDQIDYGMLLAQIARETSPAVTVDAAPGLQGTADPVLLRGLFENVIGNAVKYSPPGGAVRVIARLDAQTIVVEVEDRGIGIPADEVERVFERFARGSNARRALIPGTGFGLYFARLVAQRHGGTVSIDSRVDAGTRVVVRLPQLPPFGGQLRVLLLEHDRYAASYTEHVLRDAGYRVDVQHDLTTFERAVLDDPNAVAVIPAGAATALACAAARGVRVVQLPRPYLARDLLRALRQTQHDMPIR